MDALDNPIPASFITALSRLLDTPHYDQHTIIECNSLEWYFFMGNDSTDRLPSGEVARGVLLMAADIPVASQMQPNRITLLLDEEVTALSALDALRGVLLTEVPGARLPCDETPTCVRLFNEIRYLKEDAPCAADVRMSRAWWSLHKQTPELFDLLTHG